MKKPKLKYYCHALTPDQYSAFEKSRKLTVDATVTIDPTTGQTQGRLMLLLCAGVAHCDTVFRQQFKYEGPLYILRIPADLVDRTKLTDDPRSGVYQYKHGLTIQHCGVEMIELDASAAPAQATTIDIPMT